MDYQINTIRDAIAAFRHFLEDRSGRLHSQMAYPPRLVYYFLNIFRNAVTAEDSRIKGPTDLNTVVTKPCISFTELDIVECPCAPASGCKFYKSDYPIPDTIGGRPISVVTVDGSYTYDFVNWYDFKDKLNGRHPAERTQPYYTIKTIENKKHIYLYSSKKIEEPKVASITFVPYDLLEAAYMPECDDAERPFCNPMDEPFSINKDVMPKVFALTLQALAQFRGITPEVDVLNNENNDAQSKVPVA